MAELRLSDEQQQKLGDFLGQIAQDSTLRSRLEADPREVLGEFGLDMLLPQGAGTERIQVTVGAPDVAGYLLSHVDWHSNSHIDDHGDSPNFGPRGIGIGLPTLQIGPIF